MKEQERNPLSPTGTWERGKVWIETRNTMLLEIEYDHEWLRLSLVKRTASVEGDTRRCRAGR